MFSTINSTNNFRNRWGEKIYTYTYDIYIYVCIHILYIYTYVLCIYCAILCVVSPGGLGETELSAGLQQRHHNHIPQVFLHWCATLNVPAGGGFADLRRVCVCDLQGPQQSQQGRALPQRPQGRHCPSLSSPADSSWRRTKI